MRQTNQSSVTVTLHSPLFFSPNVSVVQVSVAPTLEHSLGLSSLHSRGVRFARSRFGYHPAGRPLPEARSGARQSRQLPSLVWLSIEGDQLMAATRCATRDH